jgi:predicted RND superfamily exporter protein
MFSRYFNNLKHKFIDILVNRPKQSLMICIVFFLLYIIGLFSIESDFTPRIWFKADSPQIQELDDFEKRFGGDQNLAIGFYSKDELLSKKVLSELQDITEDVWLLPNVIRVDSITNFNHVKNSGIDDIEISPLIENLENIEEIKKNIRSLDELKNNLISSDYKFVIIFAQLKPIFNKSPDYTKVMNKFEALKEKYQTDDNRFIALGNVAVTYAFREISKSDNIKMLPIMFLLIFVILILTFRSVSGVLAPLVISFFTIVSTFGIMGHFGMTFNSILAAIPGILVAICLADTIHILSAFYHEYEEGQPRPQALSNALKDNFLATILTSITTGISFFTISFSELLPINTLGILAGLGTLLAWLNSFLILPFMMLSLPERWIKRKKKKSRLRFKDGKSFSRFIWNFKYVIVLAFLGLSIFSFYKALDNEVNSDPIKYFDTDTKIKKDYSFTKKFLPGIRGIEVVLDSGSPDGIKDPVFLQKVDTLINDLLIDPEMIQVNSLIETLKRVNMQLNGGGKEFNTLPNSREMIAEALVLYTMGLPPNQGIENSVSLDNRYLKLRIKWTMENTTEALIKDKWIHDKAKEYGLKSKTGGFFPIYAQVNSMVVDSFFKSMSMAIILVSLIILIVFRNLFLSLISMLPNVIPLTFGAAYMAMNQIYVDIGTSIVAAICLGIAVDDTIHFVTHFVQNKKRFGTTQEALDKTFRSTGRALILTTILLVVGFGSFVMADFLPNHYFGILCAIVLTLALLTDLLLLPALLAILHRKDYGNNSSR